MSSVTPMLRVPDVASAIEWYRKVGFRLVATDAECQENGAIGWCELCLEGGSIFLRPGPSATGEAHGDVTLCFDVADVNATFLRVSPHADIVYAPRDQGYARVDFEVRDPNGYRLLFGQDA